MSAFLAPAWQFYTTVPPLWYQVYLVLFLLLSAALLSGLMFGLNALDWRKLRMLEELGDEEDQAMARHLLRLRRHGVWLCSKLQPFLEILPTLSLPWAIESSMCQGS